MEAPTCERFRQGAMVWTLLKTMYAECSANRIGAPEHWCALCSNVHHARQVTWSARPIGEGRSDGRIVQYHNWPQVGMVGELVMCGGDVSTGRNRQARHPPGQLVLHDGALFHRILLHCATQYQFLMDMMNRTKGGFLLSRCIWHGTRAHDAVYQLTLPDKMKPLSAEISSQDLNSSMLVARSAMLQKAGTLVMHVQQPWLHIIGTVGATVVEYKISMYEVVHLNNRVESPS